MTEPRTEAGRALLDEGWMGAPLGLRAAILAIEAEAAVPVDDDLRAALAAIEEMASDRDYDTVTASAAAGILRAALSPVPARSEGTADTAGPFTRDEVEMLRRTPHFADVRGAETAVLGLIATLDAREAAVPVDDDLRAQPLDEPMLAHRLPRIRAIADELALALPESPYPDELRQYADEMAALTPVPARSEGEPE